MRKNNFLQAGHCLLFLQAFFLLMVTNSRGGEVLTFAQYVSPPPNCLSLFGVGRDACDCLKHVTILDRSLCLEEICQAKTEEHSAHCRQEVATYLNEVPEDIYGYHKRLKDIFSWVHRGTPTIDFLQWSFLEYVFSGFGATCRSLSHQLLVAGIQNQIMGNTVARYFEMVETSKLPTVHGQLESLNVTIAKLEHERNAALAGAVALASGLLAASIETIYFFAFKGERSAHICPPALKKFSGPLGPQGPPIDHTPLSLPIAYQDLFRTNEKLMALPGRGNGIDDGNNISKLMLNPVTRLVPAALLTGLSTALFVSREVALKWALKSRRSLLLEQKRQRSDGEEKRMPQMERDILGAVPTYLKEARACVGTKLLLDWECSCQKDGSCFTLSSGDLPEEMENFPLFRKIMEVENSLLTGKIHLMEFPWQEMKDNLEAIAELQRKLDRQLGAQFGTSTVVEERNRGIGKLALSLLATLDQTKLGKRESKMPPATGVSDRFQSKDLAKRQNIQGQLTHSTHSPKVPVK